MSDAQNTDKYWSSLYQNGRDYSLMRSDTLSKILSLVPNGSTKRCLDIGCGTGQLTRELYHRGYACVGIDAAASAVEIAQSLTTVSSSKLQYLHFDIEHDTTQELPQQKYSLITCKLVYAFIHDKPSFLDKVKQLLSPHGLFVVITPEKDTLPKDRQGIGVDSKNISLLQSYFEQVSLYKSEDSLTYFIGRHKKVL